MGDPLTSALLFLFVGALLGAGVAWLITRYRMEARYTSPEILTSQYVARSVHEDLQQQADIMRDDLMEKEQEIRELAMSLAAKDQTILHLDDKLRTQKEEMQAMQERSRLEFEQVANRLLEEKSKVFSAQNQEQIGHLLTPLKERIKSFEAGIEKQFLEETRDRVSLKKEIEQLRDLNQQLSQDATNLANALKGDNKSAGDWGEVQLQQLLERAGLQKDIHFRVQSSFRDRNGQLKRPDFIINLPGDKHLVIDSKVSLKAYELCFRAETNEERKKHLRLHVDSIRRHIKDLAGKNYQELYQINSPDYLLLFVPVEPAFALAIQEEQQLFSEALDRNIVLVTTSTLLATMRTVSFIWKQEKQKKSVLEIARQSGLLYDRFCAFVEDLQSIGKRINQTQTAWNDAMRKLTTSQKKGDTLIGRAERIRELGARTSRLLPRELLDDTTSNGQHD